MRSTDFSDDFERADSTDLGSNWDAGYTGANNLQIVGGKVRPTVLGVDSMESVNTITTYTDCWVEVTVGTFTGAGAGAIRVHLRCGPPAPLTDYIAELRRNAGSTAEINKRIAGVNTNIGSEGVTTWLAGDVARFEISGGQCRWYRNGVVLLSGAMDGAIVSGRLALTIYAEGSLGNSEVSSIQGGSFTEGVSRARSRPFPFRPGSARTWR